MGQPREDDAFLAVVRRERELEDFLAGAAFFAEPELRDELDFFAGVDFLAGLAFFAAPPRLEDVVFLAGAFFAAAVFFAGLFLATTFESWISPSQPSTSSWWIRVWVET
jgi:hypothetical protein